MQGKIATHRNHRISPHVGKSIVIAVDASRNHEHVRWVKDPKVDPAIGMRVRDALEHRGITQRDLAIEVGIGENTISGILNGKQAPQTESLMKICCGLGVNPAWVLSGVGPKFAADGEPVRGLELVQTRAGVLGVDRWIAESDEDRNASEDERAWMRAVPWPAPHVVQADLVYHLVLTGYRQSKK